MKKVLMLLVAAGMMIAVSSCTKEGPQGPPGTNGQDANATCGQCHYFSDSVVVKIFQYEGSKHASGSTTFEGTRKDCAPCHSSQGFEYVAANNVDTVPAGFDDPMVINCRTCHQIHATYTNADWALKTTAAFQTRIKAPLGGEFNSTVSGSSANLCARCHQARAASPWVTDPNGTDSLHITSLRWGPHHGPESEILAGNGCFVIGSAIYENSPHYNLVACINCHGAEPAQGDLTGGHTFQMTNAETGDNVATCTQSSCHPSATDFDIDGAQTEIEGLLQTNKVQLAAAGILDTNTMLLKKKGKYMQADLAVYWNFQMCEADRSLGVHNFKYMKGVLNAGIAYMNGKGF